MKYHKHASDAVFWYLNELGSRVVAKTGIPSDRHHIGKLILQSLKDAPDFVMQIDGGTGDIDTFQDALEKSVGCANAFRTIGLKADDVILVMAPNFTNLTISIYAAFYLGIIVAGVDSTLGIMELEETFKLRLPKVIFCGSEREEDVAEALRNIKLDVRIVTYNKSENNMSFVEFVEKYGSSTTVDEFKPAEIDPVEQLCLLVSTSGTTGTPKCAALTHKNLMIGVPYIWVYTSNFPKPIERALIVSPVQWLSATFSFILSPMLRFTRIQTSLPLTIEHTYFLINKYKPSYMMLSPTLMTTLLNPLERNKCDFTSFKVIMLAGSAVTQTLLEDLKNFVMNAEVYIGYGLSEVTSFALDPVSAYPGSIGRPLKHFQYRLVDPNTQEDILEPNVTGELWLKGPSSFKGYYNNPQATAEIYTEDGWIKSGDLLYRDENWNFYYIERLKMLLKYRNHHISPTEVESVINKHPGVLHVAVTGIPDDECGDLAVACVVPHHNIKVTAQEIKDLVKESLTDTKQLRGGVIFMEQLPLTSTSKVNRAVLKKIVRDMKGE
ncbi:PREDICTED: luciferin 4-monooxygenase-like [Papilio xuthus]|uniref:Luciferin 4-monooxygenase-like n=1 Tax=Papilio xuthus TaxID=66420 RepID=A0AAJ7E8U9_PAPXU|nr:PREDICTED: luciferin 4-monooxygenase-like [Papilio xuthus]XP_013167432.1 PREDICTED: luciferin 4-monooxygenase-like [Papilio xuthus]XP_013167433.1 PREDICTED: luciferin 4-monooxygenase-like [Papilio xuthus]